jgi:hypothetical protein
VNSTRRQALLPWYLILNSTTPSHYTQCHRRPPLYFS